MAEKLDMDVTVIGGGPAGFTIAWLMAEKYGSKVAIVDPKLDSKWPNNYGVWVEEWQALEGLLGLPGIMNCLDYQWKYTDCFFGGSHGTPLNKRVRLDRAYARVDRNALKDLLQTGAAAAGVVELKTQVTAQRKADNIFEGGISHHAAGTFVRCDDGTEVSTKVVIDCTGHESKLIKLDGPSDPGFQIAHGQVCIVDQHEPYDQEAMLLFDYRDDFAVTEEDKKALENEPTFMYAMPMGDLPDGRKRIFFEETSLVARPAFPFDECIRRGGMRLKHLGINVLEVEEEEFCWIPMGGALPVPDQRIIGFGGAAAIVHPSTGYMICRTLAAASALGAALGPQLKSSKFDPDRTAAAAYGAVWTPEMRLQRDFTVFGGDFLMKQGVTSLRGFFDGFFQLDTLMWAGFLAGWKGLPGNDLHETWDRRLRFGLELFTKVPNSVRLALMVAGAQYTLLEDPSWVRCIVPFGTPKEYMPPEIPSQNTPSPLVTMASPVWHVAEDRHAEGSQQQQHQPTAALETQASNPSTTPIEVAP